MKSKAILVALAILTSFFGCESETSRTVPGDLLGVWKTTAPKYKDCYFELREDMIIFVNEVLLKEGDVNSISKIEKTRKGKRVLYTIHYQDREGLEYEFSFFYNPARPGSLRLQNQLQIEWRKIDMPRADEPS